ncbi:cytochrome P450 [Aspergillus spinulosporus]
MPTLDNQSLLWLSSLLLLVTALVWRLFQRQWMLHNIPGPFWAKFTDFHRAYAVKAKRSHWVQQQYHEHYGPLVRLGPNMVSVADPAAIPVIYPARPGFPKGSFYEAFIPYTNGGSPPAIFTARDEELHKRLKSPIASLYNLSNVVALEGLVDEVLDLLCRQLDMRFAMTDQSFDLARWLQYFAFDVMGTMTFSQRYGFLEQGQDVNGILGTIWKFMLTVAPMTQLPWLDKLLYKNELMLHLRPHGGNAVLKFAGDRVQERQAQAASAKGAPTSTSEYCDFLTRFLEIQVAKPSMPPWAAMVWTFSNVIAGSDSTASVTQTVMFQLLAHPESLHKLYEELQAAKKATGLRRPFPTWQQVAELPYLDACVNEAIRLHPPFCLPLERVVPAEGVVVCGQYVPAGTIVGMNPYVVNRDRPTFGEDADDWRPERWLEGDAEHRRKLEASIMTFGAGRRVCLGRNVALFEIKKIVPALVLNYKIDLLDPKSHVTENSYFFRQYGIDVRVKRRAW